MDNSVVRALIAKLQEAASDTKEEAAREAYLYCAIILEANIPKHDWGFYANGTFCRRCGAISGSNIECKD